MTTPHPLIAFRDAVGVERTGVLAGDRIMTAKDVLSLSGIALANDSFSSIVDQWDRLEAPLHEAIPKALAAGLAQLSRDDIELLPPVGTAATLYCAGANYRSHIEEMARANNQRLNVDRMPGQLPWHFVKPARPCAVASGGEVTRPRDCRALDWEAELAVVIGRTARHVSIADALDYVAGYTVANDLSARDQSRRPQIEVGSPFRFDWMAHKCFQGSNPIGPALTPARYVADPQQLKIQLWVNGVLKQDSSTSEMIFSIAEQISHLSNVLTLYPGDVVLTGTPAGVGMARQEFLVPGDEVVAEIEGLGRLETQIR